MSNLPGAARERNEKNNRGEMKVEGQSTRAVHAGERRFKSYHALVDPIFQTSAFTFETMSEVVEYQESQGQGQPIDRFEYGRYGNPTIAAAEARLAALENAESVIQVASGMAAITIPLLYLLPAGSHLIMTDDCYRRTRQFCETYLKNFNIACTVVPLGDFAALEAAVRPETYALLSETPSNPYLRILDLERFAEIGRRHDAITIIDSTLATPINTCPLDWGIDLVVHSATKYLGGHNDLVAGFIAGKTVLIKPIRNLNGILGSVSDPNTAYLLLRGMKTLALRVEHQNKTAQAVAEFLAAHPAVEQVYYPGLSTHPGYEIACRQMKGFGGLLSFKLRGDVQACYRFIDALQVFFISASLGGAESLAIHVATHAYYDLSPEERLEVGIPDNLIRLAIGIEDAQDLIADLDQALKLV